MIKRLKEIWDNWQRTKLREQMYLVIFKSHTPMGKMFDVVLIIVIIISVLLVLLDSMPVISSEWHDQLLFMEWVVTIMFTIEYILRIISTPRPEKYAFSGYGIIDLLATLPTYISYFFPGAQSFLTIRILRTLRIFRILKMVRYVTEAEQLARALYRSRYKIFVFFLALIALVTIIGTVMYIVEGPEAGFYSIPISIYWAIVTMTTVGFGDITPLTPLGQAIAAFVMLLGYSIIAVPTGIVGVEFAREITYKRKRETCPRCNLLEHPARANYCMRCGERLGEAQPDDEKAV